MPDAKKREIRRVVEAFLAGLARPEHARLSLLAQQRLVLSKEFLDSGSILLYYADRTELDTAWVAGEALRMGKTVAFPRSVPNSRGLRALRVTDLARDLEPGKFKGFLEPREGLPELSPGDLDLVVVPGRAFDVLGNRLGRGAGYYDRFLAEAGLKAVVVALAFEGQLVPAVPVLPHDRAVSLIFTEARTILAGQAPLPGGCA